MHLLAHILQRSVNVILLSSEWSLLWSVNYSDLGADGSEGAKDITETQHKDRSEVPDKPKILESVEDCVLMENSQEDTSSQNVMDFGAASGPDDQCHNGQKLSKRPNSPEPQPVDSPDREPKFPDLATKTDHSRILEPESGPPVVDATVASKVASKDAVKTAHVGSSHTKHDSTGRHTGTTLKR